MTNTTIQLPAIASEEPFEEVKKYSISANNIVKKTKYEYVGISSLLVNKIIENNYELEVVDSVNNIKKIFNAKDLSSPQSQSETIKNKHAHYKDYVLKFYKWR